MCKLLTEIVTFSLWRFALKAWPLMYVTLKVHIDLSGSLRLSKLGGSIYAMSPAEYLAKRFATSSIASGYIDRAQVYNPVCDVKWTHLCANMSRPLRSSLQVTFPGRLRRRRTLLRLLIVGGFGRRHGGWSVLMRNFELWRKQFAWPRKILSANFF